MTTMPQTPDEHRPEASAASAEDLELVAALMRGDERAFATLVERFHRSMLRVARIYVQDEAVAEEVVQDTWIAVLQGLPRFEGRSSLKTWIFRILSNRARTRGVREGRSVPFSDLVTHEADSHEPTVDPTQFYPSDHPQRANVWVSYPQSWEDLPEERLLSREMREKIQRAIEMLSPVQRAVITMRDVEGWSAAEVRNALAISEANQRVLLHRARAKVRKDLDSYVHGEASYGA